jgi:hypothetical protein
MGSVWVDSLQNRKDDIILLDLMVVGTTLTIFIRGLDIFRIPNLWDLAELVIFDPINQDNLPRGVERK